MINEEKVILMTRMASYEEGKGKRDIRIMHYFRGDFIGFQMLKSIIAVTVAFLAVFAAFVFYNFEPLMQEVYKMDLMAFGKNVITLYLCVAGGYSVISYAVYAHKYSKAKKGLRTYFANLKRLAGMYDK